MCGLVGYAGKRPVIDVLMSSLERLEYRGCDSAGIVINQISHLTTEKSEGLVINLQNKIEGKSFQGTSGMGHIRWATHGEPNEKNAHPHLSQDGHIALIHNGIIENFSQLKEGMKEVLFQSDTDTEVVVQMLGKEITAKSDEKHILQMISKVCQQLKGAYAFGIMVEHMPDKVYFAKKSSSLIIGCGKGENFITSDVPAILSYTNKVIYVQDNELGVISPEEVKIYDFKLQPKSNLVKEISLSPQQASLDNYSTYMEKEIAQGSDAMINTLNHFIENKTGQKIPLVKLVDFSNIHIVACGTALHAGRIAKFLIERECRIGVSLDFASEFRYKKPIINKKSLCLFISQSGETADTLSSLELAKKQGAYCIAITNVQGCSISRMADFVIYTYAEAEFSVASTKAYVAQITALYAFIEQFAKANDIKVKYNKQEILRLAKKLENWNTTLEWKYVIPQVCKQESMYFIGRGLDYFLAMEGALKLKEVSYIHCEAFAGGELKHGSLALITKDSLVVVLLTQKDLIDKMLNAIHEIKSRGARVILISQWTYLKNQVDFFITLPEVKDILMPFVAIKPLQELALLCAKHKGLNPDKPRNLAKSVMVE